MNVHVHPKYIIDLAFLSRKWPLFCFAKIRIKNNNKSVQDNSRWDLFFYCFLADCFVHSVCKDGYINLLPILAYLVFYNVCFSIKNLPNGFQPTTLLSNSFIHEVKILTLLFNDLENRFSVDFFSFERHTKTHLYLDAFICYYYPLMCL